MDDLGFFERIGALLIMSVVVILFLSVGVAVIAVGVAVGHHLVEPIGDLPRLGWAPSCGPTALGLGCCAATREIAPSADTGGALNPREGEFS